MRCTAATLMIAAGTLVFGSPPDTPVKRIETWLAEQQAAGFSGAVLVAHGGQVTLARGYGLADREGKVPFERNTVFSIGSITKQFTAAAILRLEMAGRLAVSDTIARFLPEVPADKRAITLHQLLTHTSGLESDFAGDFEEVGRDGYVRRALASTLRTPPGAAYHYANSGYSLLAAIVEIVSGQSYEAYLHEHVLAPAKLTETGYRRPRWPPERIAQGYRGDERWGTILGRAWAEDGPWWGLRGNGGIHSTLDDLYRWHTALNTDVVLSAEAKRKMFAPHVAEDPGAHSHYGYGWAIFALPGDKRLVAHNGGNGIFSADFRRYLDDDLVVIAASNTSRFQADTIASQVAQLALGLEPERPAATNEPDALARRRAEDFVAAFSTGDVERMRAYRAEHMANPGERAEERDTNFRRMFAELGPLTLERVASDGPESVQVHALAAQGPRVVLTFELTGPERKIAGIRVEIRGSGVPH